VIRFVEKAAAIHKDKGVTIVPVMEEVFVKEKKL
jgi:hypothetical protein